MGRYCLKVSCLEIIHFHSQSVFICGWRFTIHNRPTDFLFTWILFTNLFCRCFLLIVLNADSLVHLAQHGFLTACKIFTLQMGASARVIMWSLLQLVNVVKIARSLSIQVEAACRSRRVIVYCAVNYDLTPRTNGSRLGSLNISLLFALLKVTITVYGKEVLVLNIQRSFVWLDSLQSQTVIFYVLMYIIFRCGLILNCVKTSWWTRSNPSGMRITTRSQSYQLICLGCVRVLHLSQSQISPNILTRQISSTHDIASWNAFLKVHTWNHWLVLNDWLRIRIQNCRSLRRGSSFSGWLLVKSIVIDETLVILERMQTPFCFLKRLDMLEIAYIEGSPLLVDESVPLRFVRVEFLLDGNYRFPSAMRSHLPSLSSWSDLGKTCLWLVSSSHGWLHPISRRN